MSIITILKRSAISDSELIRLCRRNADNNDDIKCVINAVFDQIFKDGDKAVKKFSNEFDGYKGPFEFNEKSIAMAAASIDTDAKNAIDTAYQNIYAFHEIQKNRTEAAVETMEGVLCWRERRPIESVGLYVPGGSAVLISTLLMLGIPARIAGCNNIVVCTPPAKDGQLDKYLAYILNKLGMKRLFAIGGAQAIAAMAYGTERVPRVDKIFGPGNLWVTEAKLLASNKGLVSIDLPAGPSEVLIVADGSANPAFVAADLLSQAEHGPDSRCILLCMSASFAEKTKNEIETQIRSLPRSECAVESLKKSWIMVVSSIDQAISISNMYAPEHVILHVDKPDAYLKNISNAGSVFLGAYAPESVGDYASGTNHTLPTSGFARSYSGLSTDSFFKTITFQKISKVGLKHIGPTVMKLASLEKLEAHASAVSIRLNNSEGM